MLCSPLPTACRIPCPTRDSASFEQTLDHFRKLKRTRGDSQHGVVRDGVRDGAATNGFVCADTAKQYNCGFSGPAFSQRISFFLRPCAPQRSVDKKQPSFAMTWIADELG